MELAPEMIALVRRAHGGDSAALEDLLAELRPVLVRSARLIVGSGSMVAEDVAQEALLDISRGIDDLRDPGALKQWALTITTRRAMRAARKHRMLEGRRSVLLDELEANSRADDRAAALKQAFDHLPPRLRATAVLRLHAGLSEDETAAVLNCSVGTVKSNLHDARMQLTQMLVAAGYAPTVERKEGP